MCLSHPYMMIMDDLWVRIFTVSDPQSHRKGFTVYKVTSIVYPRNDPAGKTEVVVWKRYSDFRKLHKDLKDLHEKLYLKDEFPPFIKPRLFGRFEADVIEERRAAAYSLLEFVAAHPPLFKSKPFVRFLEKSYSVLQARDTSTNGVPEQKLLSIPDLSENADTVSVSSSHSTLTDTDSGRSAVSSPRKAKESSRSTASSLSGSCIEHISLPSNVSVHNSNEKVVAENGLVLSAVSSEEPSLSTDLQESADISSATAHSVSAPAVPSFCESTENKESSLPVDTAASFLIMDYMTQAGYHVSEAVEHETNARFEAAFISYKNAISILLSGVQDDPVEGRKLLIQKKAAQYLLRAEHIYHNHLSFCHSTTRSIPQVNSSHWNSLETSMADLQAYKVLGVIATVIVAINTHNDTPCIIKVLHKSPCPVNRRTKSIIPTNVPFMCRLFCYMENEHSVFLVLEQAKGGCLWDHIRPYFDVINQSQFNPANELEPDIRAFFQRDGTDSSLRGNDSGNDTEILCPSLTSHHTSFVDTESKTEAVGNSTSLMDNPKSFSSNKDGSCSNSDKDKLFVPDVLSRVSEGSLLGSSDVPDILPSLKSCSVRNISDIETENLLRNSQKLLDSVSKTLCKSSLVSKKLISPSDFRFCKSSTPGSDVSLSKRSSLASELKTSASRDRNSAGSRDYKPSVAQRHRHGMHFSCDDMFEGRARALSHSLDREALQMNRQVNSLALPIDTVCIWAAELVLALDALHRWGIVIGDLRPENLLVGREMNIMLTYQCCWVCVDRTPHPDAIDFLYAAPEVGGIEPISPAADWWSYGALLYEMLSGQTLASYHPGGIQNYSTLLFPPCISGDAADLLRGLLKYNAQDRLGFGPHGVAKLKSHSFFKNVEWNNILLMSAST